MGRSLGEGKGCPLQYSGLENSTDSIVHEVAKRQTRLSDFHFQIHPRGRLTRAAAAWSPPQAVLDRSPGSCLLTSPPGFGHRWLSIPHPRLILPPGLCVCGARLPQGPFFPAWLSPAHLSGAASEKPIASFLPPPPRHSWTTFIPRAASWPRSQADSSWRPCSPTDALLRQRSHLL